MLVRPVVQVIVLHIGKKSTCAMGRGSFSARTRVSSVGWGVGGGGGGTFRGIGVSGGGLCFPVPLIERLSTAVFA